MVSSCGFNAFSKYNDGDLVTWSSKFYMPRVAERYCSDPDLMPWDFSDVVAALAPKDLFVNTPLHDDNLEVSGVRDSVESAMPTYQTLDAGDLLVATYSKCKTRFFREREGGGLLIHRLCTSQRATFNGRLTQ